MIATASRDAVAADPTCPRHDDAAVDSPYARADADSAYLRRWVARQAARYEDLLATVAATQTARPIIRRSAPDLALAS